jgi:two-component system CheB/CheR fusion protein
MCPAPLVTGVGQRVLLVEDHLESAASMERLLQLFGYEVRVETNGLAAVEAAPGFAPFAALIDLTLPVLDGFAVAERLRAIPVTRDALLIAMTGWATDEHAQRARAAGFDKHLVKPLSADLLVSALAVHA